MLRDLCQRSDEREIMDAGIGDIAVFDNALNEIETVNRLTLGYRPVLFWLGKQLSAHQAFSLLDIGFGRGGLLRSIGTLAKHRGISAELTGIDIAVWSADAARRATPADMSIDYRVGDVFASDIAADFIVCSHTTHHMTEDEIVLLIRWLERHARRGWFIVDLHRHIVPYLLTRMILFLAPVSPMVRNDGAVSITRAFTRQDWQKILQTAGVDADIRWYFPFRYGIARMKS